MVKINDPRFDRSSIAMRVLRAKNVYKEIIKNVDRINSKNCISIKKLKLKKCKDMDFYEDFLETPHSIQQELLFLWEEVGALNDFLNYYENENNEEKEKDNEEKDTKVTNHKNIFGP